MLTLVDSTSRREFLRIGGLALGGLTLPGLMADRTAANVVPPLTGKSVVFLFMHGGPPQIETFDPKMNAPDSVRSVTGERATSIPGVTYGGTLERLAALAHKTTIVRSFTPGDAVHNIKPVVSRDTAEANLGSIYSRVAGTNDPQSGMPRNVILFPRAVDGQAQVGVTQFGRLDSPGALGQSYAPLAPDGDGDFQRDLRLSIPRERFDDRRTLLTKLDELRRGMDATDAWRSMDGVRTNAYQTILRGVAGAFDLSREDPSTLRRYDTSRLSSPQNIDTKWHNFKNYRDHGASLGKLLLLARRLCEAGCGFVTVTTSFVWDFHADINNAPVGEGMKYCGIPFDHAVSAFVEDCEARGLGDRILLVCCGEMGRSPKLNARGGRDHWGDLGPLLLYGGGLKMGRVIGRSNRDASAPSGEPVTIPNLVATVMHTLLDVPEIRVMRGLPADVQRIATTYEPIADLR